MKIALVHDYYDQAYLDQVVKRMKKLGTPTIKAVWVEAWGIWCAIEGCHRLRAAEVLGLTPEIDEIEYTEDVMMSDLGLDYQDETTISDVVDSAYGRHIITFEAE